jgi:hypothetical protein
VRELAHDAAEASAADLTGLQRVAKLAAQIANDEADFLAVILEVFARDQVLQVELNLPAGQATALIGRIADGIIFDLVECLVMTVAVARDCFRCRCRFRFPLPGLLPFRCRFRCRDCCHSRCRSVPAISMRTACSLPASSCFAGRGRY